MTEQVSWWIEAGKRDEEMARILLENDYLEGASFHIQQSAVKYLKALEIKEELHSNSLMCVKILDTLSIKDLPVDDAFSFARKLDLYYTDSRYPINGPLSKCFDESMVVELFVCLERIQSFVNKYF